jgi:hypothetical protein
MTRPVLIHLLFMLLGYVLAVLVSTAITLIFMNIASHSPIFSNSRSYLGFSRSFQSVFTIVATLVTIYTFPCWLITVVIAEARNERRWRWFAAAGALTAILAISIASFVSGRWQEMLDQPLYFSGAAIGWFLGNMVYWAAAGRRSGQWRQVPGDGSEQDGNAGA